LDGGRRYEPSATFGQLSLGIFPLSLLGIMSTNAHIGRTENYMYSRIPIQSQMSLLTPISSPFKLPATRDWPPLLAAEAGGTCQFKLYKSRVFPWFRGDYKLTTDFDENQATIYQSP
jgi:hypothetical protein